MQIMKPSRFLSRLTWIYASMVFLAACLAVLSVGYMQPQECETICTEPEQAPCPTGACRFGQQRAGFPLPFLVDRPTGSSPTSGWGKVGVDDTFVLGNFLLDAAFYAALLWVLWQAFQWVRGHAKPSLKGRRGWQAFVPLVLMLAFAFIILTSGVEAYQSAQSQVTPDLSSPKKAILGNWTATDGTGQDFLLRFFEDGRLFISPPGHPAETGGQYSWDGDSEILITFVKQNPSSEPETALCSAVPAIFKSQCRYNSSEPRVVDGSAYPFPVDMAADSGYPAPTSIPLSESRIEARFEVSVDITTLTLTGPDGSIQQFQRAVR